VAHDLSITSSRFDHISPAAVGLAALLHGAVVVALLTAPPRHSDPMLDVVEVSLEQELTPPPTPKPPDPPPVEAAAPPPPPPPPTPTVQQPPQPRMGLRDPPIGTTMDRNAPLVAPQVGAAEPEKPSTAPTGKDPTQTQEAREEPKPEPPKEIVKVAPPQEETVKSEPVTEQQVAALAPQPPPPTPAPPKLENALPPVEAPPPPVTAREIPALASPPPPPPPPLNPQPAPRPQAPPPPAPPHALAPQQQPAPSPLHPPPQPQQRAPGNNQQASRAPPSTFVNPADAYGQRKSQEDYLWTVVRQISQHRYYPKSSRENSEEGMVVTLVTIARDGRLIGATISRSSGYRNLDNAVLDVIRQASPYPPLPNDLPGDRHTFLLPLNYKRTDPQ